jgi:hypothetical protein
MKKTIYVLSAGLLVIMTLTALILDAENMTRAAVNAVETCLYTIIPALFGFMVIASYLLRSGLYRLLFKPLYFLLRPVIRLGEEEFGIFLLSLFGGYPIGAKLIADRTEKITDVHRRITLSPPLHNILPFCYCPSPGFVISVVGIGVFANPTVGLAVYLSNVSACIVLAVFLTRGKIKNGLRRIAPSPPLQITQDVFIKSVTSAASALFPVCAVITAFGVLGGALRFYGIDNSYFFAAFEISNVKNLPPDLSLLPLFAALFSFGGLCIIMQIPALLKRRTPLRGFFLWRIPAALLSALICRLTLPLYNFDYSVPVTADTARLIPLEAGSPVASVSLLIMALILVKTVQDGAPYDSIPRSQCTSSGKSSRKPRRKCKSHNQSPRSYP